MGNTSSHASGSATGSGAASPISPHGLPSSTTSSAPAPTSTSTTTATASPTAQPIRTTGSGGTGTGTGTGSSTAPVAFHSGLTPPARDPSPPPPSTPPLLPYGGHLSPQNPHAISLPQTHDYSKSTVTSLILEARLAPFYRGLEDYEENWTEEDLARTLTEVREQDLADDVSNSVTEKLKEEREAPSGIGSVTKKIGIRKNRDARREEENQERDRREVRAYLGATECPICFLHYPPNINTSRCCQQPICTECFVQIKRGEPTLTHLESEPACCPFCVETEFGVIYERPALLSTTTMQSDSALAVSPEAGTSGFSQALSAHSEDAELSVGPGMAPKAQEKMRRKSVSSKAAEVVTIDQIRPDWEHKLNAVKAAAARKASRRIVMRQVGDRLIPIGFTSARAPGTADFSMSVGQGGTDENGSRRTRRSTGSGNRSRDLEELMIMEAMRLSLLDHDEHQRRLIEEPGRPSNASGSSTPSTANSPNPVYNGESSRSSLKPPKESSTAKFLSKLGNRSRSGSTSSNKNVSFANFTTSAPRSRSGSHNNSPGLTPTQTRDNRSASLSAVSTSSNLNPNFSPVALGSSTSTAQPVPPVTTLASHTTATLLESPLPPSISPKSSAPAVPSTRSEIMGSGSGSGVEGNAIPAPASHAGGIPRLSVDMAPMQPEPAKVASTHVLGHEHLEEHDEVDSGQGFSGEGVGGRPTGYARLDSDFA